MVLCRLMHSRKDDANDMGAPEACSQASFETDIATLTLAVLVRLTAHAGDPWPPIYQQWYYVSMHAGPVYIIAQLPGHRARWTGCLQVNRCLPATSA